MSSNRAQVSIEFIILVGALLVMVIAVFPYILKTNELNKALSAARDGATFGAAMRGVGYQSGSVEAPPGRIKIKSVTLERQGRCGSLECYRFRIVIMMPSYYSSNSRYVNSIRSTIRNQALRFVYYAFNGDYPPSPIIYRVDTSYYSFNATTVIEYY